MWLGTDYHHLILPLNLVLEQPLSEQGFTKLALLLLLHVLHVLHALHVLHVLLHLPLALVSLCQSYLTVWLITRHEQ